MPKTKQVFISHATKDAQFAHRLANDLKRSGVQVWIAPESIPPGEDWVSAIECGLEESSYVVVVLTPAALESKWVEKETDVAIARERRGLIQIIPVDVKPCKVPPLLSSYQMVSFHHDYDGGLSRLASTLGVHVTPPKTVRPTVLEPRQPFEPEMILIPAGDFLMGSDPKDTYAEQKERPQHTVYLPDYYLAKTPVTNAQYAAFVQDAEHEQPRHWRSKQGRPPRGKEDHPVTAVSWWDAKAYCEWLTEFTRRSYDLPSEAEWEKGARGSDGRIYPWGDRWDKKRCNSKEGGKGATTAVGVYPEGASPYGLLDMVGNVWEWTRSSWKKYPYNPEDGREEFRARGRRVLRGGAFDFLRLYARCATRLRGAPGDCLKNIGFRVVLAPDSLLGSGI